MNKPPVIDLYSNVDPYYWRLLYISLQFLCFSIFSNINLDIDRLCGLVVRVLGYRSGDPGSIPDTTRKKVMGLELVGLPVLSLVSTTKELLDGKVAAPV
jgi:hypothetical protein